jgi:hypothetical protein
MTNQLFTSLIEFCGSRPYDEIWPPNNQPISDATEKAYEAAMGMPITALITDTNYQDIICRIKPIKKIVELKGNTGLSKDILVSCLQHAWGKLTAIEPKGESGDDKWWDRIFEPLCLANFKNTWSDAQKDFFKTTLQQIRDNNVYFISYTNKLSRLVNEKYYDSVCKLPPIPEKTVEKNLLADSMAKWLGINNMRRGFFDNKSLRISEAISDTLKENCKSSFIFIQLIDTAALSEHIINWTHEEYKNYSLGKANSTLPAKKIFYVTDSTALPKSKDDVYPDYEDWYTEIMAAKHVDLYKNVQSWDTFTSCISELLDSINTYKREWFDKAPDN